MGLFLSSAHLYGENNSLQFAFYTDCHLRLNLHVQQTSLVIKRPPPIINHLSETPVKYV